VTFGLSVLFVFLILVALYESWTLPFSENMRATKIVATLGPSSDSPAIIRKLMEAGADVFRLNASHGTPEQHLRVISRVREASKEIRLQKGILLDLQGPKIRLGKFEGGECRLESGSRFVLTTDEVLGNSHRASTTYKELPSDVKPGDRILLADGSVELRVASASATDVICEVISGGRVGDRKGINLPGVSVSAPSLTSKDLADVRWGLEAGVDMVALSFVRTPEDLFRLRSHLQTLGAPVPVIAKIEKPEAWHNLDGILNAADGVMVARGDLGVEMALEEVPQIQKTVIRKAREQSKFVITATQMLESMIENPTPTRAEVSDVANAIYDGTDAVMLSAETSAGKYPVEAVAMMSRIASTTRYSEGSKLSALRSTHAEIVAEASQQAARAAEARAIVVFTETGLTARLISRYRAPIPVVAFAPSEQVARQLTVVSGVFPVVAPVMASTDEMIALMDRLAIEDGRLRSGDPVVFVAGQPIGRPGTTNMMILRRVGGSPQEAEISA
jgi:pyruvate kinase